MSSSHITPVLTPILIVWLAATGHCQYDPYGGPPFFQDPLFPPLILPPEGPLLPQGLPFQQPLIPPFNDNNRNYLNPFLAPNQGQASNIQQQQQQDFLQQVQGSYPNFPSLPFQTVSPTPSGNPFQPNKYPFNPNQNLGNLGNSDNNQYQGGNKYPFNPNNVGNTGNNQFQGGNKYPFNPNLGNVGNQQQQQQQQQPSQQSFGNALINQQQYPKFPNFPFQTVSPTQFPQIDRVYNPPIYHKPRIPLPRIRVIEFPSSEYFEYGGGKLVQPKRPNADLYVGGTDGDVPLTSKIFIECTGPNQVEWLFNGSAQAKELSVVTKNIQITVPEQREPTPGSGEYTYLRLGLEEQISEKNSGAYICRDRILPQNYISIRILVASTLNGEIPNFPIVARPPPQQLTLPSASAPLSIPQSIGNGPSFTFNRFGFGTPVEMEEPRGRPNYPFDPNPNPYPNPTPGPTKPRDPNTIYFSRRDSTVTLPCKIEDAQATISLHKRENGKLSCPFSTDGRVGYDRYKGFIMQIGAFHDIEGRYVCVGDFNGELRLMKYTLAASDDFTTRYVEGDSQNVVALDGQRKSSASLPPSDIKSSGSSSSSLLVKDDSFPKSVFSGITVGNLTGAGLVDPRSEFDIEVAESSAPLPVPGKPNSKSDTSGNSISKASDKNQL